MKPRFLISLTVALLALILFEWTRIGTAVSLALSACWVVLFVAGLIKFKKRALWLLLGAPFALFWPISLFLMLQACAHNVKACP